MKKILPFFVIGILILSGTGMFAKEYVKPEIIDISDKNYNGNPSAIIETSMGTIYVELYKDLVPDTVDNFIKLSNDKFYDGLVFHRVIDNFIIQGGAYYPDGSYKSSPYGPINLEIHPNARHVDGAIAMARAGDPNSATSQFYICDGPQPFLDDEYAVFGKVTSGSMSVVRSIAEVSTAYKYGHDDWPVNDVRLNSIIIIESDWIIESLNSFGKVGDFSFVLDKNNYPHISYCFHPDTDLKYAFYDGSTWIIETVDSFGDVGADCSLALDSNEYPHISYHDFISDALKYAYYDGNSWSISTLNMGGLSTSLALDGNDYPHICHYEYTYGDLRYAFYDGTTWIQDIIDFVGNVGMGCKLALDSNDYPHISYYLDNLNQLKYALYDGNNWQFDVSYHLGMGISSSLALDSNNHPHISFTSFHSFLNLTYAFHDGNKWNINIVDSSGNINQETWLAVDSNDYPHICYTVGSNNDLMYTFFNGNTWMQETVASSTGLYGTDPKLALDKNNNPHIVYYDETDDVLKYARKMSGNHAPDALSISGETNGKAGVFYDYCIQATDPDGDDMTYYVEWGDGGVDEGLIHSEGEAVLTHSWTDQGSFTVRVKVIDIYEAESNWAELSVSIPKNRATQTPFLNFLENHPILYQLLLRFLRL